MGRLKARVTELYTGQSPAARRLRYWLILFDLATVAYFIVTVPLPETPLLRAVNAGLAALIAVDFVLRFWISGDRWRHLTRIYVLADLVVILSLVLKNQRGDSFDHHLRRQHPPIHLAPCDGW